MDGVAMNTFQPDFKVVYAVNKSSHMFEILRTSDNQLVARGASRGHIQHEIKRLRLKGTFDWNEVGYIDHTAIMIVWTQAGNTRFDTLQVEETREEARRAVADELLNMRQPFHSLQERYFLVPFDATRYDPTRYNLDGAGERDPKFEEIERQTA